MADDDDRRASGLQALATTSWVQSVATLDQVLARLRAKHEPELLIIDGSCEPDLVGAVTRVRAQLEASALPLLLLAPRERLAELRAALEAGADDFLLVPHDELELRIRVEALARRGCPAAPRRLALPGCSEPDSERLLSLARTGDELFRTLADTMPLLAWYAEPNGYVPWFNRRWLDYTGLPLDQLIGLRWQSVIEPERRERVVALWEQALARGQAHADTFRLRRHDGVYRWFLSRAEPLRDESGRIVRWFGTNVDIDDHKRAEQTLAFLTEAGRVLGASLDLQTNLDALMTLAVPERADLVAVYLPNPQGRIEVAAVRSLDARKEELLREIQRDYPQPDDAAHGIPFVLRTGTPQIFEQVPELLRESVAVDQHHLALLREVGTRSGMLLPITAQGRQLGALLLTIWLPGRSYAATDLLWAEELARRVGVALDNARLFELTERERVRAEEANRAKDQFLSIASHELRTPLNAILGWSQMLRRGLPPSKQERAIETIERNARAQVQLIDDILDVSRIFTGKLRLEIRRVDLAEIVSAAIEVVQSAADAKDIELVRTLEGDMQVHGDPGRLQQIVWNLLSNAIKFTPPGGRVQIAVRRRATEVEVAVSDTGRGIDPRFLGHMFEPFRQAEASTTRTTGGLGLGLAIVKHLVELHGGRIEAQSEGEDQGSTFSLQIPVSVRPLAPKAAPGQPTPTSANRPLGPLPSLAGLRILVVDDEPDARELLRSLLGQCGAELHVAGSANEAFTLVQAHPLDLLISDIGMPGEDGYSLIRRVRELGPAAGGGVPAIALTAFASSADRERALAEGFGSHISKPVEAEELLATIVELTGGRR